jgi:hypothetical protein
MCVCVCVCVYQPVVQNWVLGQHTQLCFACVHLCVHVRVCVHVCVAVYEQCAEIRSVALRGEK